MVLKIKKLIQAFLLLTMFSVILGGIYPCSIYVFDKYIFHRNQQYNLIEYQNKIVGSFVLGQNFTEAKYFWGRPTIEEQVKRIDEYNLLQKKHGLPYIFSHSDFPADFIYASASGLDPHVSVESAMIQLDRVSRETGRYRGILEDYIALSTERRQFGFMGQSRVNVVKLNLLIHAQ